MLLFLIICCSTVVHLVYSLYWRRSKLKVVQIADGKQGNSSDKSTSFLTLAVDVESSLSNATNNVSGVSVTITPVQSNVDLHVEDPVLGHAGEVATDHNGRPNTSYSADSGRRQTRITIAVGGGITSSGIRNVDEWNVASQLLFYSVFLPTFCRTASRDFAYRIYLAYDHTDPVFGGRRLQTAFRRTFHDETRRLCGASGSSVDVSLHLVECSHAGKPTWAQNDAMMEAYLDDVDYFYRVNDDTRMLTDGWTEKFISTLENYDPPRVGVVGPKHTGGNVGILTYDFVHRTHVDIFGFYYPRLFTGWWADDWITQVYSPHRSTKLADVRLSHTMNLQQRYVTEWTAYPRLTAQINADKQTINR